MVRIVMAQWVSSYEVSKRVECGEKPRQDGEDLMGEDVVETRHYENISGTTI